MTREAAYQLVEKEARDCECLEVLFLKRVTWAKRRLSKDGSLQPTLIEAVDALKGGKHG